MALTAEALPEDIRTHWEGVPVLLTGGLGFIGSNIAVVLAELGAQVTVVDALLPAYGGNRFNVHGYEDRIRVVEGDIRDDKLLAELVAGQQYIYHLAAQVSYIDSKDQPFLDLDINGRGYLTLLEAVRDKAPQARVLFASSRLAYGKIKTVPVTEDHPTDPVSLYGIHKLLGEKYGRYYTDTFGIPTVAIRIPNPYGPRQQMKHNKYSIVGWFLRQAMEDKEITIFGDGAQERDYLFIDDIVTAFLYAAVRGQVGAVYNIGTHERVTFVQMVDAVLAAVGSGKKVHVPWPANYEKNETGNYVADTTRITTDTEWQAQVPLQAGIQEMVDYYQQYREHYWN